MRAILGIGNPGIKYSRTRHNAGFMFVDYFAARNSIAFQPSNGEYYLASGKLGNESFILIKPTTYVNQSGRAAFQVLEKYQLSLDDLLVVVDDVNLKFSDFRFRISGGDGGHNGLKSIIFHLNSDKFSRIRLGIGQSPSENSLVDYVLGEFDNQEQIQLKAIFDSVIPIMEAFITAGLKAALDKNSNSNFLSN